MAMGGDINALSTFPIEWWLGRRTEDQGQGFPAGGHYPYARPVRTGWTRDATGRWVASGEDPHEWEVFCEQCGDADGPADGQPTPAREIRGPYPSKHKAVHAAKKHFDRMRPSPQEGTYGP